MSDHEKEQLLLEKERLLLEQKRLKQEALVHRHGETAELLHRLTATDLRLTIGFVVLQLLVGSWYATNRVTPEAAWSLGSLSSILAVLVVMLLRLSHRRRKEATITIKACNALLGYEELTKPVATETVEEEGAAASDPKQAPRGWRKLANPKSWLVPEVLAVTAAWAALLALAFTTPAGTGPDSTDPSPAEAIEQIESLLDGLRRQL